MYTRMARGACALLIALSISLVGHEAHALIRVGFVDSGLSASLPRFQKYVVAGQNSDDDLADHGTAVVDRFLGEAEAIGIPAGELEVRMERVDDSLEAAAAIARLIDQGVSIIHISESYYFVDPSSFETFRNMIEAKGKNILFVISAGDERIDLGKPKWHSSRVSRNNVLVAGGVTSLSDGLAFRTNYGSRIDLVLGLHSVQALSTQGNRSERNGLSFLIPALTAEAARLHYENPRLKPSALISALKSESRKVRTVGKPAVDAQVFSPRAP
jgi:hypothetical protein